VTLVRAWSVGFGLIGLGVSIYLVATHYFSGAIPLACAGGGIVNCEQVTSRTQSIVGPIPVAVLGLAWFLAFLGLLAARNRWSRGRMAFAPLAWSLVGLLVVFYLIYAELFLVGAICLWCTVVHAVVIALFLLSVWDVTTPVPSPVEAAGVAPAIVQEPRPRRRLTSAGRRR
jgi:uncharacterized membrane protein